MISPSEFITSVTNLLGWDINLNSFWSTVFLQLFVIKQFENSLVTLVNKSSSLPRFYKSLVEYNSPKAIEFRESIKGMKNIQFDGNQIKVSSEHRLIYVICHDLFHLSNEQEFLLNSALVQHKQGYKIAGVYCHLRHRQLQGIIKEYENFKYSFLYLKKCLSQLLVEYKSSEFFNLLNYSMLYKSIIQEDLEAYCLGKPKEKPIKFLVGEYSLKLFEYVKNNNQLLQRFQFLNDNISLSVSVGSVKPEISYEMALAGLTRNFYSRIYFKSFKAIRYPLEETIDLLTYDHIDPIEAIYKFNYTKYLESLYIKEIRRLSVVVYT